MLNENAKKWVEALRSGKYKQGQMRLCYDGKYCCLGVGCEVAIQNGVKVDVVEKDGEVSYNGRFTFLPYSVRDWLGLENCAGKYHDGKRDLTTDNDCLKLTFAQIADIIESEPEGLFVEER